MVAKEIAKVPARIRVESFEIVRSECLKVFGKIFGQGVITPLPEPVLLETMIRKCQFIF